MNTKLTEKLLNSLKLLYIENDENYSNSVSQALKLKLHTVYTAKTIKEAVSIYNDENIDIIVSELSLNNQSTKNFINSIRNINKYIPIIIISSIKDANSIRETIKFNLTDYIFKPIDIKTLKDALSRSAISIYDAGLYEVTFLNNSKYNVRKKLLILDDEILTLTTNEVRLLDILVFNQQALLSKEDLKNMIWENSYDMSDEALKSLMTRLRKKIGKEAIQNISGSGYILNLGQIPI